MIEKGYNKKYAIYVATCDSLKIKSSYDIENVHFISTIHAVCKFFSCGYVFYCIGKIPIIPAKDQEVMQFWHGQPFKKADEGMLRGHNKNRPHYTYALSTSKHFAPIWSYQFQMPIEKIYIGGQPRCDALFLPDPQYNYFGTYKKIILWTPTFRQSNVLGYKDIEQSNIVPIIQNKDFKEVNDFLKTINVKIVVKLHPAQDLTQYKGINLDHFVLLSHVDFTQKKMDLYRFMTQCDALITDYSSIFYDYLLLDRPIGFTEDDIDQYGNNRGFAVENPDSYRPGFRIKTKEDLCKFAELLANGIDDYKNERERVNRLANDYRDGGFCERILNKVGISK